MTRHRRFGPLIAVILLVALLFLLNTATSRGAENPAPLSGRLANALADPAGGALDDSGRAAVWVRFTDRGPNGAALTSELREAASQLPLRTRERRLRNLAPGRTLVDEHDLPVNPAYVDAVSALGAAPRRRSRLLNAASFDATPAQIAEITRLPFVAEVDLVGLYTRDIAEVGAEEIARAEEAQARAAAAKAAYRLNYGASLAGLEQINVPAMHDKGLSGAGVTVAVFDTGFELDHECFADLDVIAAWDFVGDDGNVGQEPRDPTYSSDHGTEVLGILAGFSEGNLIGPAYGSSLILARTEDTGDETRVEEDNWIAALEWAESLGADVVSSSVGYYQWYNFSELDGATSPMTIAADLAALRGVCVVVGVGSQRYSTEWPYILAPADGHYVIAAGSVDLFGFVTSFSSAGPTADGRIKPDVMAQGIGTHMPLPWILDAYGFMQGNDSTVPLLAGAVALLLEAAPYLTPVQVREALRETASRSLLPDNDFGWGVANLQAAAAYWLPRIEHTPPVNQQPGTGQTLLTATITGRLPLDAVGPRIVWRTNGGNWNVSALVPASGDEYTGTIPAQIAGTSVEYYLQAANELGHGTSLPASAPASLFSYEVANDTTPPAIETMALSDQSATAWPPVIRALVTDDVAVDRVDLNYAVNDGPFQDPVALVETTTGYEVVFPVPAGVFVPGTRILYALVAWDTAPIPNMAFTAVMEFEVVSDLGRVLMVSDRYAGGEKAAMADARGAVQVQADDVYAYERTNAEDMARWLTEAGFVVDIMAGEEVVNSSFLGYDVVFYTAGNTLAPLPYQTVTDNIVAWVADGGRLLIEGGDLAYYTLSGSFGDFAETVLHISAFGNDDGRTFSIPVPRADHPFLHRPFRLAERISLELLPQGLYDYGASDVVFPAADGTVILQSDYGTNTGGVVIHDDNTGPDGGETVYFPFDMGWMAEDEARPLLVNAMTYLTLREPDGPSSISGRVTLGGSQDHAGATVTAGRDHAAVTAADGTFTIEGLWGGSYQVTATAPGFSTNIGEVDLTESAAVSGVDLYLQPVVDIFEYAWPDLAIPDNDPLGAVNSVSIGLVGRVAGISVDVDISHYSVGNLEVVLTSPAGTSVTLHATSDNISDDLVGSWPTTLYVDGPGSLADFRHETAQGLWTLRVADLAFGATGRLNAWGLNLQVIPAGVSGTDGDVPAATRLLGNRPNPFNPRTSIAFALARPARVRLEIYDVRGRLVRSLVDGDRPAGAHMVAWDGTDGAGSGVASGVYFYRLDADGHREVGKMMLVR